MSTVPVFDSQETIRETQSQELFEGDPPGAQEDVTAVPNILLRDILKEIKEIKKKVEELQNQCDTSNVAGPSTFRVEDQNFKKPFFQFLKKEFCASPWINLKSEEFMEFDNMKSLRYIHAYIKLTLDSVTERMQKHIGEDPYKFKTLCSFASHKFTQLRNQLRRQIFHSTLDVQSLSLDGFCSYLYKTFTPPGQPFLDEKSRRMTVVIRAFLSQKKFEEGEKFWVELKAFYDAILNDRRENIYDLIKEGEERRIKRYVHETNQQGCEDI